MRRFILILLALGLVVSRSRAASSAETHAYNNAANAFRAGIWDRADKDFGTFVAKFPNSTNVPEAILLQAQARVQLGRLAEATDLLTTNWLSSGDLADEYLFWKAEIFFQRTNYFAAATNFAELAAIFPRSAHRLDAALGEAAADAELAEWGRVEDLLSNPKGVFQLAAMTNGTNEVIFRGGLLLARAQSAQKNYSAAESTLTDIADWNVSRSLKWQRLYSLSQVQLADDRAEDALRSANGLPALADSPELRAQSVETQAEILRNLHREDEAIAAYRQNLSSGVPVAHQQQALFKMAELSLSLDKVTDTTQQLQMFLNQNTNSPLADVVVFTLGDMQLKQYLAGLTTNGTPDISNNAAGISYLKAAMARFQALTNQFPSSSLVGRALLNEGWCYWFIGNWSNSAASFQLAAHRLPSYSEDQLVARFKWADAQSRLKDFVGAKTNYDFVAAHALASAVPAIHDLAEPALYQLLGASFDASDVNSGERALYNILNGYPSSFVAPRALLLAGKGYSLMPDTVRARDKFMEVEQRYPNSPYLPEARLAIARTYEQEQNWTNAIAQYDDWLAAFTNNPAKPRVEYYRGWANFQAGNETNALSLFTNFVAQFPADALAPYARWWIADHYFREGDFVSAEKNYQVLHQDYPTSELAYQAWLMAGRSAMARSRPYPDAVYYFTNLTSDLNCPPSVRSQALFAYGEAQILVDTTGATNKQNNLLSAVKIFSEISPTNSLSAPALGRIGDCYLQLGVWNPVYYESASNAYAQVVASPQADIATRSQARVGLGIVAEKQAQQKPAGEQTALLAVAFSDYNDVILGDIVRPNEKSDPFWTKRAGIEAGRVAESLGYWVQAIKIYQQLEQMAPPLQPMLEKKIAAAKKSLEGSTE